MVAPSTFYPDPRYFSYTCYIANMIRMYPDYMPVPEKVHWSDQQISLIQQLVVLEGILGKTPDAADIALAAKEGKIASEQEFGEAFGSVSAARKAAGFELATEVSDTSTQPKEEKTLELPEQDISRIRSELVELNSDFANSIAEQYQEAFSKLSALGLDANDQKDIVHEGQKGLVYASEHFDPKKDSAFPPYALWEIAKMLNAYFSIRFPSSRIRMYDTLELCSSYEGIKKRLGKAWGYEAIKSKIAPELNLDPGALDLIENLSQDPMIADLKKRLKSKEKSLSLAVIVSTSQKNEMLVLDSKVLQLQP